MVEHRPNSRGASTYMYRNSLAAEHRPNGRAAFTYWNSLAAEHRPNGRAASTYKWLSHDIPGRGWSSGCTGTILYNVGARNVSFG